MKTLIIDFDSTFIKLEALDTLAKIVLANSPYKEVLIEQIENITCLGMEGKISFEQSLCQRLKLFSPTKDDIEALVEVLKPEISESFKDNLNFFRENAKNIYIISGGFRDYIWPVIKSFGIYPNHILANEFITEGEKIVGVDLANPLAYDQGKVKVVAGLNLKNVWVIGDGMTDYQIKLHGLAEKFIAFVANVRREVVAQKADFATERFDDIVDLLRL